MTLQYKYNIHTLSGNRNVFVLLEARTKMSPQPPALLCIGECPSNSPFPKNNGAEAHCF